jgi:hypothetical protein
MKTHLFSENVFFPFLGMESKSRTPYSWRLPLEREDSCPLRAAAKWTESATVEARYSVKGYTLTKERSTCDHTHTLSVTLTHSLLRQQIRLHEASKQAARVRHEDPPLLVLVANLQA